MHKRRSINGGIIMITVGILFLLLNMFPGFAERLDIARQWPLIMITLGVLFFVSAIVSVPSMAIPASIITGIGGILYYQNLSGNWASWAYIWALIPGFVGIGIMLSGILDKGNRKQIGAGIRLVGVSAVLFFIFAFFFTGLGNFGQYWPILLILLGLWLIIRNRFATT